MCYVCTEFTYMVPDFRQKTTTPSVPMPGFTINARAPALCSFLFWFVQQASPLLSFDGTCMTCHANYQFLAVFLINVRMHAFCAIFPVADYSLYRD